MAMGYGRGKRSVPAARMEGNMQIYVNAKARCDGDGTKERPFKRINDAAKIAKAGDEVLVMPGLYR